MGHSWGSMLGLLTVSKYPELFFAYMGIGQVTNQYEAEIESLEWVKNRAIKLNDKRGIKKLNSLTIPNPSADVKEWDHYLRVHRAYLFKYGGTYHKKVSLARLLKDVVFAKEYTLKEKMMLIPSALYSLKCLFADVVTTNLFIEVASVKVPVYIFQGVYDYQVSYRLAKSYIEKLKAPHKELISFENSAHSPITEEYERFNEAVINIVKDYTWDIN
jgi:pimeloyl-ACP methyl ester carboxylesterase